MESTQQGHSCLNLENIIFDVVDGTPLCKICFKVIVGISPLVPEEVLSEEDCTALKPEKGKFEDTGSIVFLHRRYYDYKKGEEEPDKEVKGKSIVFSHKISLAEFQSHTFMTTVHLNSGLNFKVGFKKPKQEIFNAVGLGVYGSGIGGLFYVPRMETIKIPEGISEEEKQDFYLPDLVVGSPDFITRAEETRKNIDEIENFLRRKIRENNQIPNTNSKLLNELFRKRLSQFSYLFEKFRYETIKKTPTYEDEKYIEESLDKIMEEIMEKFNDKTFFSRVMRKTIEEN